MSKFIKKQQYNSIDENIYDEFVDIDSITIEEIDKEIEDFYIDKEKINNNIKKLNLLIYKYKKS